MTNKQEKKELSECCGVVKGQGIVSLSENTQNHCSGCGEPFTPQHNLEESWEEEFDKEFVTKQIHNGYTEICDYECSYETPDKIKQFISKTRQEAYEEGKKDGIAEESVDCYDHCQEAIADERKKMVEMIKNNIGMLRQWLNEDRITDVDKMVDNKDLEHWIFNKLKE